MRFYLGTHHPNWLSSYDVPLFVSRRRLFKYKTLPVARGRWALDSGGFSELSLLGKWSLTPAEYAVEVRRYQEEVGNLDWAAPMDWMCEPKVRAVTGLSVEEHQHRTIDNFIELRSLLGTTVIPVLQGWDVYDYLDHETMYRRRGIDLTTERLVGVGTVCRRQNTDEAKLILDSLVILGLRLHGFGIKISGIGAYSRSLTSADSMAWSYGARRAAPLPGHKHLNCANCIDWALAWRGRVMAQIAT